MKQEEFPLLLECRPIAIKHVKEIAEMANKRPMSEIASFFGLCCSLIFQNAITNLALNIYRPGSPEGLEFIRQQYAAAMKDAEDRWHKQDLKNHFEEGN